MTQKGNLFKGKQKKKSIPLSRHGKAPHIRKGKRVLKSLKSTTDMEADRTLRSGGLLVKGNFICISFKELTKFINQCNETKAATVASKEGGEFSIPKTIKTDQSKK